MSLLDPLRRPASLPPSKVDIGRALRDGRRRERNRRALAVAAAAIAVGATIVGVSAFALDRRAPAPPADETPSPSGCSVHRLPTPGDDPGTVAAVDPGGGYAVGRLDTDGRVLVWASGVLQVTENAPQPDPSPAAVNAAGIVVGNSGTGPWMLRDGAFKRLATPPGAEQVMVAAINAGGDIAGTATTGKTGRIVRWNAAHPDQVTYVTSAATPAVATAIGDDGTIVGTQGGAQAARWSPDGTVRPLNRPSGRPALGASGLAGDWAFGFYEDSGMWFNHGVRWNLRTGESKELGDFAPGAIDATGRMFGTRMLGPENTPPALWRDGEVLDLPVLSPGQSATVTSASADGRLVAGFLFKAKNDPIVAVRWAC
ncbi:hypothetical protein ABT369_57440 [Dactylosporangium sp. NPDC000244]|uniref:hypothetical protein n=1 Tax=Dactylosporangium sp. NPDC000244 TaxID=3154365 RepID=UPI0033198E00